MVNEARFSVKIEVSDKAFRVPKEVTAEIKGVVSRKMLSRMKKEYVNCPVVKEQVPFLVCFVCPSFLRRVKGIVHCAGEEGPKR